MQEFFAESVENPVGGGVAFVHQNRNPMEPRDDTTQGVPRKAS